MLLYLATETTQEGPNPVVPATGEIIIGLIAFGILAYVLGRFVWPRMEATFEARRDAIEGGIRRAEEAQEEAKRLLADYRQQLAEARTEAAQIRDNARAEGQRIIEEMRTTAQEESARIVARGEEQLTIQRQQVVRELRGEIGTLATELAERVIGESLADDRARQRTVDRFLDDLDGMAASVPAGVGAPAEAAEAAEAPPAPGGGAGSRPGGAGPGGGATGEPGEAAPDSGGGSGSGPSGSGGPSSRGGGSADSGGSGDSGSSGGRSRGRSSGGGRSGGRGSSGGSGGDDSGSPRARRTTRNTGDGDDGRSPRRRS